MWAMGSYTAHHALHMITTTLLTRFSSFSVSVLFYDVFFLEKSNLYYIFFSFLSSFYCDTILSIIVHWVKCVCSNRTRSPDGVFVYYVVYPTLPSIEQSLAIIIWPFCIWCCMPLSPLFSHCLGDSMGCVAFTYVVVVVYFVHYVKNIKIIYPI